MQEIVGQVGIVLGIVLVDPLLVETGAGIHDGLARRAYAQDDLSGATDDASLVERLGETVHAVEGDVTNLKVTTPDDLKLVRAILGVRAPAERASHKRF